MKVLTVGRLFDVYTDGGSSNYSYQLAPCGALTIFQRYVGEPASSEHVYAPGNWLEVIDGTLYRGD